VVDLVDDGRRVRYVGHGHRRPFPGKAEAVGAPDALGATGHDGNTVSE
jgi:hypothetical protein